MVFLYLLFCPPLNVHIENRRSYFQGLKLGYLTQDPSQYNNPDICAPYIKDSTSNSKKLAKKQRQRHARENYFWNPLRTIPASLCPGSLQKPSTNWRLPLIFTSQLSTNTHSNAPLIYFSRSFVPVPMLAEQRALGGPYIVGTTDDRTFCLLWNRVIQLLYFATHEAFNTLRATLQ